MIRLFRVAVPTSVFVLLLSEFVILTFCYVLATYLFLQVDPSVFLLYDGGLSRILTAVASILFALHFLDLYSQIRTSSKIALGLDIGQDLSDGVRRRTIGGDHPLKRFGVVHHRSEGLTELMCNRGSERRHRLAAAGVSGECQVPSALDTLGFR